MKLKLLIILIISFLLTGCYDYKELNSIAIISATEINKIDNEYIVTVQAINPQAPDKTVNTQAPFIVYEGKGKTIQEAYRNITMLTSRYLYSNHLQLLIINENIAKENINEIIDFYLRNPSIRTEFYVAIGKSNNILSIITPLEEISSTSIKDTIEINNKYLGTVSKVTFNDFIDMKLNPNIEITLPSIEIINNEKEENTKIDNVETTKSSSKYKLSGLAVFKNNVLKGYLSEEQSKTYNIINNNINNTIINYECDKDKYLTIEIIKGKTNIDIKNNEININISLSGNINESHCNIEINNYKNIKSLENKISKSINNSIQNDINNIKKEYNSDIYGFLDLIYKYNYKEYTKIKSSWYNNYYQEYPINIKTKLSIIEKGNILEVINEENK